MREYLDGAIPQLAARARYLLSLVPSRLGRDVDVLIALSRQYLIEKQEELDKLTKDPALNRLENQRIRMRRYRRAVEDIELVESVIVASLSRWTPQDRRLNALADKIATEMKFPLSTPVVCGTSHWRGYYRTYQNWNLIVVPLAEGQFLLHLPDLYHEFAHLLVPGNRDPRLEPIDEQLKLARKAAYAYIATELEKERRRGGQPSDAFKRYLNVWLYSWDSWLTEFFCDLFATAVLGPAYAWANFHLVATNKRDPFEIPLYASTSHPPDAVRMGAILDMLGRLGFQSAVQAVDGKWSELLALDGYRETPEFRRCFPQNLVSTIVSCSMEAVTGIGCTLAVPTEARPIAKLLNDAWSEFWAQSAGYSDWESNAAERLLQSA